MSIEKRFEITKYDLGQSYTLTARLLSEKRMREPLLVCLVIGESFDLSALGMVGNVDVDYIVRIFWNREVSMNIHTTTLFQEIIDYIKNTKELEDVENLLIRQYFFDFLREKKITKSKLHDLKISK